MYMRVLIRLLAVLVLLTASTALAGTISWTDWDNATTDQVSGTMAVDSSTVDVTFSGSYTGAQTSGGTNYWVPSSPYISSTVENAPPDSEIIRLNTGGTVLIEFSQTVVDPVLALVSWNGNTVDFGVPIEFLSYGAGYWGNGTPDINQAGTGFYGAGEVHGVIQLSGEFDSIEFTHTSENWHGFTVGVPALAGDSEPSPVPEPSILFLLSIGLGAVGLIGRRIIK